MIKRTVHVIETILLLALFQISVFAQVNDAGCWMSVSGEKKINPVFSASLSEEIRLNENISEAGTIFSDVEFSYKLNKLIKISVNYRFTNKRRPDNSYDSRNRFYVDVNIKKKFSPVTILFRSRIQTQYTDYNSSPEGQVPKNYFREKLTLKYDNNKKIIPYFSYEFYYSLNNVNSNTIDNTRKYFGFEYAINRKHSFNFFYLIQSRLNVSNPQRDFVTGVGYKFNF
ncbi:MAG: hypothetical protein COX07_09185 [Bacteroidetes bacterium CG23_combo_of_CG06-09_8_20_14_all_32_9]|nr:MAG: hypothetical protein COX07_09185 [Bacteroidetes bacterium CG23_combo_of_CG06-09_8_20_14_all_32_9]